MSTLSISTSLRFHLHLRRGATVLGRSANGCGVENGPRKGFVNYGDVTLNYDTIASDGGAVCSCRQARARGEWEMSDITALQEAVLALPEDDYARFRAWFSELDWEKWDRQIVEDSEQGKLDFLVAEAQEAKRTGTLREL